MFLRTGCRLHLDKYIALGQQHPHFGCEDVGMARDRVNRMLPVERYRVMGVGYRTCVPGRMAWHGAQHSTTHTRGGAQHSSTHTWWGTALIHSHTWWGTALIHMHGT